MTTDWKSVVKMKCTLHMRESGKMSCREIRKQFRRQNIIYIFSNLVPVFVWLEFYAYISGSPSEGDKAFNCFVGWSIGIIAFILLSIHMITSITFWNKVNQTMEELHYSGGDYLKIGKLLVSEKFILDYGMFRKRIISFEGMFRAKNQKDHVVSGNKRVAFDVNSIILMRRGQKQISVSAPVDFIAHESQAMTNAINDIIEGKKISKKDIELYKKYPCDFPFYGLLSMCIIPIIVFFKWLYPYIRDLFVSGMDKTEMTLFCVAYEGRMQTVITVMLFLLVVGIFIFKHYFMGINLGSLKTFFALLLLQYFIWGFATSFLPWDFDTYKKDFQKDYRAYKHEEFETEELILTGGGIGNSWSDRVNEIYEKYDLNVRSCRLLENGMWADAFYLIDNDMEIESGNVYYCKYLKNTRIIVEIQKLGITLEE